MRRGSPPLPFAALQEFCDCQTEEQRLALGEEKLEAAWAEASDAGLLGWVEEVWEYLHAVRTGTGLNRPL